jgi:hypothetical protein
MLARAAERVAGGDYAGARPASAATLLRGDPCDDLGRLKGLDFGLPSSGGGLVERDGEFAGRRAAPDLEFGC